MVDDNFAEEFKKEQEEKAKLAPFIKMVEDLTDTCNHDSQKLFVQAFAEVMCRTHRTLQQLMVGMMVNALTAYSKEYDKVWVGNTDARNEAAVVFCKKLAEELIYFPYV